MLVEDFLTLLVGSDGEDDAVSILKESVYAVRCEETAATRN